MDAEDNIQLPINLITVHILMSVHPQDTFSKKLDQLRKSTVQDNQLTRLSHYINTGFPCDKKNLLTDLQEFWNYRDTLSIKNGLITCGSRIIVPYKMRAEMLQYIHEGHQGKERCLLQARNTVFWPKITYDIQELIERSIICQEHGKSQSIIGTTQELPPFPWHTLATDIFYWKRMDFLIVTDVFSKYFLVRKLANSSSAAVCAEIATIVTELGLPHIIRSDNGPCYNSKEFQQLLQCYNITHHTSSPHHPRSNGFVERMVGVAKKLMDKAGSEGKPWISGLYEYRVTPQSSSIASPLQLITQCAPREKDLPQLPSTLGAQEMYEMYVQHRQNTSWEPATVVSQCSSNSYWIMQENGTDQPRVYRRTRNMLKIRCTNIRQTRHNYSQLTESEKDKFQTPSTSNAVRNYVEHNSVENVSQDLVHPTKSDTASASLILEPEEREEIRETADVPAPTPASTSAPALERVEEQSHTPGSRKSTRKNLGRPASSYSDFYM